MHLRRAAVAAAFLACATPAFAQKYKKPKPAAVEEEPAASAGIQVLSASGTVTFNNKPVKTGDTVEGNGTLTTGADSAAKVYLRDSRTISILKANTVIEFTPPKKKVPAGFRMLEGLSRWIIGKGGKGDPQVTVSTRTAVMGVRGTEFMAVYNKVMQESELICFDGVVELRRKDKPKGKALVKKNQWGGIGGRFGEDVGKIIDLPPPVIDHFKAQTALDTELKGAVANPDFHGHAVPP